MGYLAARRRAARFVVVSNDKGYAPLLEHAAELGFTVRQVGFGNPAVAEAALKGVPVKKAAPAGKAASKQAATKKPGTKATAKKVMAKKVAIEQAHVKAAKAPTKTAMKTVASKNAAPLAAVSKASSIVNGSSMIDLKKSVSHVAASLGKTAARPAKYAKLMATIQSLIGPSADGESVDWVLTQLLDSGEVVIDATGGVRYPLWEASSR